MTVEDQKYLREIFKSTSLVNAFYHKLYKLEIDGKKASDEYYWTLKALQITLDELKVKYEEANLDYEKCLCWSKNLIGLLPSNFTSNFESVVFQEYDNRVIRRMLCSIFDKTSSNMDNYKEGLPEELSEIVKKFGRNYDGQLINNKLQNISLLTTAIEREIYSCYFLFLEQYTNERVYSNLKNKLIVSKYYATFINKQNEEYMITNAFQLSDAIFIESKTVSELLGITSEQYDELKDDIVEMICHKQILTLLDISDYDYGDSQKLTTSILSQSLLKSSFLFMSDEKFEYIQKLFNEEINSPAHMETHGYDRISKEIIKACFDGTSKDKEKIKVKLKNKNS